MPNTLYLYSSTFCLVQSTMDLRNILEIIIILKDVMILVSNYKHVLLTEGSIFDRNHWLSIILLVWYVSVWCHNITPPLKQQNFFFVLQIPLQLTMYLPGKVLPSNMSYHFLGLLVLLESNDNLPGEFLPSNSSFHFLVLHVLLKSRVYRKTLFFFNFAYCFYLVVRIGEESHQIFFFKIIDL